MITLELFFKTEKRKWKIIKKYKYLGVIFSRSGSLKKQKHQDTNPI